MNKQAIIYARVSTDEQAIKGYSIKNQIEECRRYAMNKGIEVVEEIQEDFSGATLDRPGFMSLQTILTDRRANAVIVVTADRLSRNYIDGLVVRDQWEKAGIELHYVDTGQAQDSFQSVIGDMFSYAKGHFERKDIARRTSMGRISKAKNGKPVMSGYPPYGYDKIGKYRDAEMIINAEESEVVRMIFGWYTSYKDGGPLSLYGISRRLDEMGIRPRYASLWSPTSVRVILKNEIYVGRTYYQKTRINNKNQQIARSRDEWISIDVPHLAIIDKETFNQAQVRAKLNKERSKRNRKGKYLLSGHFRCGCCGYSMFGVIKNNNSKMYYCCASHNRKDVECQHKYRYIPTHLADEAVWHWLYSLLEDEATLKRGINAMSKQRTNELLPKKKRLETLNHLLDKSTTKIRRLVDELSEFQEGAVCDVVKDKIKVLEAEQKILLKEKNQIENELAQIEITPKVESQVLATAAQIRERLPNKTFENMRYLLDKLNVTVTFQEDSETLKLHASCSIPGSEGEIEYNYSQRHFCLLMLIPKKF